MIFRTISFVSDFFFFKIKMHNQQFSKDNIFLRLSRKQILLLLGCLFFSFVFPRLPTKFIDTTCVMEALSIRIGFLPPLRLYIMLLVFSTPFWIMQRTWQETFSYSVQRERVSMNIFLSYLSSDFFFFNVGCFLDNPQWYERANDALFCIITQKHLMRVFSNISIWRYIRKRYWTGDFLHSFFPI